MRGRGRCAVRVRLAAAHPRRAAPHDRRRRRSSLRPPAGIPSAPAARVARPHRVLPHACAARSRARPLGRGRDQAPPARSRGRPGRPQASRRPLGPGGRPRSPISHPPRTPRDRAPGCQPADVSACDGARTLTRPPGRAAAARRGPPRAGRVRPDAVRQVGGHRDPEHPRMGRAGDRGVDQARPSRRDTHRPRAARQSARVRPARSMEAAEPHVVAARQLEQLEWGTSDRAADGLRRRD